MSGEKRRKAFSFKPRGCLNSLAGLLAVVLVLAFVVALWADAKLNRVDATPATQVSNTAGTNWLLVGSDSRQGLTEEDVQRLGTGGDIGVGRTDTIMILHLPTTGEPTLLSIPRDSYVNVPGWGMDKANAAFSVGGPELLTQTVEEATGLRIDHYAEIGMGGLANMVDAVGGVEMCPAEPIQDPLANLDIQAGCQEFDGATALGYVRTRATAMGDLDRVVRQREFFSALLSTATSPGTLLNPFRIIPMITNAVGTFTVGEGDHVWHLARLALAMRGGIQTETVPIATFADYDVGSVVIWDDAAAEELFSSMR
ncbi:transcriptional regulator [Corynebacterium deserti GIMN1.010]|uniref:Transcriptional regulator n=1 Tax=Corynebacterium deserti GIMN1.010 TaxID=931089 RepID=A0A0M4CNT0_9CORY|nr:transcriptional regulator [Corynebacterium deserti GIMN1.010]